MLTAIVGINWGDEGKGRMVDLLSEKYDIVSRYQGGNNAGHTVVNEKGKFILNLLPSGILRDETVNIMGPERYSACATRESKLHRNILKSVTGQRFVCLIISFSTVSKRTGWAMRNSALQGAVFLPSMPINI